MNSKGHGVLKNYGKYLTRMNAQTINGTSKYNYSTKVSVSVD